jgi:glycosyltransferase involved in cell wall biosynthesis
MRLALCMVVKDEVNRIAACLDPIVGLIDELIVIDTGSTDGTPALLQRRYGVKPITGELEESRCLCKCDLRNRAFQQAGSEWILSIDADERIAPELVERLRRLEAAPRVAGYFGSWLNHLEEEPEFEDYKLFVFRNGFRKRGLVHENVQIDVREKGFEAKWMKGLVVHHHPEAVKQTAKTTLYRRRLECGLRLEPHWFRYYWFLGYMDFQVGDWAAAKRHLEVAVQSRSPLFPVEGLNSAMVLAEIHARNGEPEPLGATLQAALRFYDRVANDFEVRINFRLKPWLDAAMEAWERNDLDAIRAYRFAR